MRVLVTGATGLLGSDLCRRLSPKHDLIGWARRVSAVPAALQGIRLESVDLTDAQALSPGLARWKPHVLIHTAAMSDVDACESDPEAAFAINRDAAHSLAKACSSLGAFLVVISTDYVFDGRSSRPYLEEDPPHPISQYGQSKREGEEKALALRGRVLVVRVSGLFGVGRPNFVSTTVQQLKEREPVPVVTDQVNSPSYTVDVSEGLERLILSYEKNPAQADPGGSLHGVLHLANAGGASRWEVASLIAKAVGAPESLLRTTTWAALGRPARRPANSRLDCGKIARLTRFPLRLWADALRAFLDSGALEPNVVP